MSIKSVLLCYQPHRLQAQVATLGAVLLSVVIGVYGWYTIQGQTQFGTTALEDQALAHANNIAAASAALLITKRYSEIEQLLVRTAQFPDIERIQVCNRDGRVFSDVSKTEDGEPLPRFDVVSLTPPTETVAQLERHAKMMAVWQPIEAGELLGWVRIEHSLRYLTQVRSRIVRDGLVIGALSVVFSVMLFLIFLRRPIRAVEKATSFASRLDESRGGQFLVEAGTYEVEQLGRALNHASLRLHDQERTITATTKRLQSILRHAIDGIITTDGRGVIESINPAAEKIFGYREQDAIGRNISMMVPDLFLGGEGTQDSDPIPRLHEGELRLEFEVTAKRRDGNAFPLMIGLSEMQPDGRPMYIGIVRDISERKKLDRMQSDFIASVSHELRTPLASLHGSLGLIAAGEVGSVKGKAKNVLDIAFKNCGRLVRLINDILDFEKLERGHVDFQLQEVEILPLVHKAIAANEEYAQKHKVKCEVLHSMCEAKVLVDPDRMIQVISLLLMNAVRLSPANDSVEIDVRHVENTMRLAVTDHGPGIPDDCRHEVFRRFTHVDSSDIRYKEGAGLGLSIAKTIIDNFGGNIYFDSRPNVETTFYIDLPEIQAYD